MKWHHLVFLMTGLAIAGGCRDDDGAAPLQAAAQPDPQAAPTNRIDVPATVRQNLGITFAKVERRPVTRTIRVPGRFELIPSGRREYRTTLPGWITLDVKQYDRVDARATLWQLESPAWHSIRKELHESQSAIARATAELAVAEGTMAEAGEVITVLEQRVKALAGAEVRRAELEAELATRRATLPRLTSEIAVKQAALDEAHHDFALELDTAAALLGTSAESLAQPAGDGGEGHDAGGHKVQRWYTISRVGHAAAAPGVVEAIHATTGAWVDANALVLTTIDPSAVRFRATGLQSDLGRLTEGLSARVVPPPGIALGDEMAMTGTLTVGPIADPDRRTIELLMTPISLATWARPGVSAMLEVAVDGSDEEELAIPAAAVVQDGLTHVFFRRDPANPDKVIRVEADLGVSDGKRVVVRSGVKAGDEIVLDGVYELKLSGAGRPMGGGHFHADGSWHADPDQ